MIVKKYGNMDKKIEINEISKVLSRLTYTPKYKNDFTNCEIETISKWQDDKFNSFYIGNTVKTFREIINSKLAELEDLPLCELVEYNKADYEKKSFDYINFIQFHSVDAVICVNDEKIRYIKNVKEITSNINITSTLLGFFTNSQDIIKDLQNDCYLDKEKHYENVIGICYENIIEFSIQLYKEYQSQSKSKDTLEKFVNEMLELTLMHEFGHLIFANANKNKDLEKNKEFKERQANYFCSYIFDGQRDELIRFKTKHQPSEYQNPLLLTDLEMKDKRVAELYDSVPYDNCFCERDACNNLLRYREAKDVELE